MSVPRIAIVGRPNVGKSSLMNMLARARVSIVDPTPGVTRDRVSRLVEIPCPNKIGDPKLAEITDTGGYGVYNEAGRQTNDVGEDLSRLTDDIEFQIAEALTEAQLILFVIDAQTGITPLDETVARLIRESNRATPMLLIANKVDSERWEPHAYEAASLGMGEPTLVSAAHGFRKRLLLEAIYEALPDTSDDDLREKRDLMKLAVVGKRNSGKSTLINVLAGEDRVIVSDIAGTTRDSVDVQVDVDGVKFIAIDTAGVRKRKSLDGDVEWYAYNRALRASRRADVVLFLIDAAAEISQVDKQLSLELQHQFKPCVIVVNKWDVVEERNETSEKKTVKPDDYSDYLDKELPGLSYAPIVFMSALNEDGITDALHMAFNLYRQAEHRESTGRLNTVFKEILRARGPSSKLGLHAKLYYVSQIDVHPPTIAISVNKPELFGPNYRRYLLNALRKRLPYSEIPIRLIFRPRTRADLADLLSGEHRKAKARSATKPERGAGSDLIPGRRVRRGSERAIEAPPLSDDDPRSPGESAD
ncbi:MAG: ribosome biogenesis GTPase Der [Phycisphaerales bacterium]|nr:ribosome biogenesis GTPase Der [Phycisphaerales bacterium]